MKNIALIAESPNDADSIKNLLAKRYKGVKFKQIAKTDKGNRLESLKLHRKIKAEAQAGDFTHYIFIRDLDGLQTEVPKMNERKKWFEKLNKLTKNKGIFLLNIYSIEALILADINSFNNFFGSKLKYQGDPMRQKQPKEHLIHGTKSHRRIYKENDCPEIFAQLDINTLINRCAYFKDFIATFEHETKLKKAA